MPATAMIAPAKAPIQMARFQFCGGFGGCWGGGGFCWGGCGGCGVFGEAFDGLTGSGMRWEGTAGIGAGVRVCIVVGMGGGIAGGACSVVASASCEPKAEPTSGG